MILLQAILVAIFGGILFSIIGVIPGLMKQQLWHH